MFLQKNKATGIVTVSEVVNGKLVTKRYLKATVREAIRKFTKEVTK